MMTLAQLRRDIARMEPAAHAVDEARQAAALQDARHTALDALEAQGPRLARALDEFVLEGPHTNLGFHRWLVSHPEFAAGNLSTRFIDEHFRPEALAADRETSAVALLAAALHAREERLRVTVPAANGGRRSPWRWAERRRTVGRTR